MTESSRTQTLNTDVKLMKIMIKSSRTETKGPGLNVSCWFINKVLNFSNRDSEVLTCLYRCAALLSVHPGNHREPVQSPRVQTPDLTDEGPGESVQVTVCGLGPGVVPSDQAEVTGPTGGGHRQLDRV